ncbi:hypothetical protein [Synechococcus sp. ROS8604]|uniref:hypothetical protein n=1 Tax=Synechococcus sp. ROS8604 TaxID=1442557 RepID=UPI001646ADB8|nr:hypothetical protein [Synechococcus sp. ROS8604]QNI88534.1 hypothetical protein SynROS8604_01903 [Synechococcus sp. ROS8604]
MSTHTNSVKAQITRSMVQRIASLDQSQRYEDSYAITQEFREWLLDPKLTSQMSTQSKCIKPANAFG